MIPVITPVPRRGFSLREGHQENETASGIGNMNAMMAGKVDALRGRPALANVPATTARAHRRMCGYGLLGCAIVVLAVVLYLASCQHAHAQLQPGPLGGNPDGTPYSGPRLNVYPATYAPIAPIAPGTFSVDPQVAVVNTNAAPAPEPAAWLLGLAGAGALWIWRRRRQRRDDLRDTIELFAAGPAPEQEPLADTFEQQAFDVGRKDARTIGTTAVCPFHDARIRRAWSRGHRAALGK